METEHEAANDRTDSGLVDEIVRYENDEMSEEEEVVFFQKLIDNGLAWSLQGHYGRTARWLIDIGACKSACKP